MAATVNARDVLLQAAPTRTTVFPDAAILLGASTNAFHVANGGAFDPGSITIRATLISIEGVVTFNATGCILTGISGNSATLTYANMSGGTASITASITVGGVTVTSNSLVLTKVFDGAPGAPGAPGATGATGSAGARGAGQFYATGSAWSDAAADSATPGANVLDDVVTISNGTTFASTKRWSGSAWVPLGVVIDGALVVEGSITAAKVNTNGLTVRAPDGTLILSSGGLNVNYAAAGTKNSDIRLGARNFYLNSQSVVTFANNTGTGTPVAMTDESVPYYKVTAAPGNQISTYTAVFQWAKIPVGTQCVISCDVRIGAPGSVGFYAGQGVNSVPVANKWTRISYVFTYDGTSRVPGHTYAGEVMDYRNFKVEIGNIATDWSPAPEDVDTSIAAAAAQAAIANAEIANFASDNVLSRDDKSDTILKFSAITGELAGIRARADAQGVSRTSYDTEYSDLNTYLGGLSPAWNDLNQNTTIVGTTFRSMFADYYNARQALLNAISASDATTATWNTVTGVNRPSDNATADITLSYAGTGMVVAGNTITRTTSPLAWDAGAWSMESFAGGAFASGKVNDALGQFMFGLNTDPTLDNSYTSLDYAIYFHSGTADFYESNTYIPAGGVSYVVGDMFAVTYDGAFVRYIKNGIVIRTVAAVITKELYFDSSFHTGGASLANARFGPLSSASNGLNLVTSGAGIKLQGSTVSRTGGSTWDASVRSIDGHTGGAACSFVPQPGAHFMMGLNTDPATDDNYTGIDYCFYSNATTSLLAVISGTQTSLGSYTPGSDVLSISYDNNHVSWSKNGVLLKTAYAGPGLKFHLDSSIVDGTISNLRFGPMSASNAGSTWLNSAGMLVSGGVFTKNSATGWDQQVYSAESYTGGAYAKATAGSGSFMFGLNTDPATNASYTSLDYAVYCDGSGALAVYESNVGISIGTYAAGDVFAVLYDNVTVTYQKNGNTFRQVAASSGIKMHFDSSFNSNQAYLSGAEFGPLTSGLAGATALTGLASKLNKAGADTISGPISLTAANAILVGTTNDGIFYGSTGIYGRKAGFTTFSVAADGTALFGGALAAASGTFGSVSIASGGSISSGQTAYATGTGWWMGLVSGVPKFSIGDSSQYVRWTGTALEVKLNQIVLGGLSTLSSPSGANGTRTYGTRTASITSGGTAPFTYNWYMAYNYLGRITLSGASTATVTVQGTATNDGTAGELVCIVTDSNGLSATVSCGVSGTHGSPP